MPKSVRIGTSAALACARLSGQAVRTAPSAACKRLVMPAAASGLPSAHITHTTEIERCCCRGVDWMRIAVHLFHCVDRVAFLTTVVRRKPGCAEQLHHESQGLAMEAVAAVRPLTRPLLIRMFRYLRTCFEIVREKVVSDLAVEPQDSKAEAKLAVATDGTRAVAYQLAMAHEVRPRPPASVAARPDVMVSCSRGVAVLCAGPWYPSWEASIPSLCSCDGKRHRSNIYIVCCVLPCGCVAWLELSTAGAGHCLGRVFWPLHYHQQQHTCVIGVQWFVYLSRGETVCIL